MTALLRLAPDAIAEPPQGLRRTPASAEADAALLASVRALGLLQPILVRRDPRGADRWLAVDGRRRLRAAREAGLDAVPAMETDRDDDAAAAAAEAAANMVRAGMAPVDQWRAVVRLQELGWTLDAAALALGLPGRLARRLDRLGQLHPEILAAIEAHGMPADHFLAVIASAPRERQAEAWAKHGKAYMAAPSGRAIPWYDLANACRVATIPKERARFGDDLAAEFGVVWQEDLFAQPGDAGAVYTTYFAAFEAAQRAWCERERIPELRARGYDARWIGADKGKEPRLPKGATRVEGSDDKAPKTVVRGYYLDHVGELRCSLFKLPAPPKAAKGKDDAPPTTVAGAPLPATPRAAAAAKPASAPPVTERPPITKAGLEEIARRQTEAVGEELRRRAAAGDLVPDARRLLACMILLLDAGNVTVASGGERFDDLAARLIDAEGRLRDVPAEGRELERVALVALARSLVAKAEHAEGNYNKGSGAALDRIALALGLTFPPCDDAEFLGDFVSGAELRRLADQRAVKWKGKAEVVKALAGQCHPAWAPAAWRHVPPAKRGWGASEDEDLAAVPRADAAPPPAPEPPPAAKPKTRKKAQAQAEAAPAADQACGWDGEHECPHDKAGSQRCHECPRAKDYDAWWNSDGAKA